MILFFKQEEVQIIIVCLKCSSDRMIPPDIPKKLADQQIMLLGPEDVIAVPTVRMAPEAGQVLPTCVDIAAPLATNSFAGCRRSGETLKFPAAELNLSHPAPN
jgi:hypothetical protein